MTRATGVMLRFRPLLALMALAAAALGQVGISLVDVARTTRAAPPEEFGPTAFLIEHLRHLELARGVGVVALVLVGLWLWRRPPRIPSVAAPALPRQKLLWALPEAGLIAAVGLVLLVSTELVAVSAHRGELFSRADFLALCSAGLGAAMLAGLRLAAELMLLFGLFVALLAPRPARMSLQRSGWVALLAGAAFWLMLSTQRPLALIAGLTAGFVMLDRWLRPRLLALPVIIACAVWGRATDVAFATLGNEVRVLGLGWLVHVLFALLAITVAVWTLAGVRAQLETSRDPTPREWVRVIAAAFASPLTPLIARTRPSLVLPGALAGCGVMVGALLTLIYPDFTDFSQVMQRIWSTLLSVMVVLFAILARLALPLRWPGRVGNIPTTAVLTGALLAGGLVALLMGRGNAAQALMHEYTRTLEPVVRWSQVPLTPPFEPSTQPVEPPRGPDLPTSPLADGRRPLMVVILWDAARADHTTVHGYERNTTPVLEGLAAESVVFERAWSSATATSASLRHLFTGRHSSRYMLARDHGPFFTGDLVAAGYERIHVNILGTDYNGVSRDAFVRNQPAGVDAATHAFGAYHEDGKMTRALELIDQWTAEHEDRALDRRADGLFLFLHLPAPHYPWRNYSEVPSWGPSLVDRYDASVAKADQATGHFLDGLRQRGLYNDAVIVVTADHGTGLGDHGRFGGFHPYEEQVHVPLVVRVPGISPRRVAHPVVGIDLAPTLVGLVTPAQPNRFHGHSLVPLMTGAQETLPRKRLVTHSAFEDAIAILDVATDRKLHLHRTRRYTLLFNRENDPEERQNLSDTEPGTRDALLRFGLDYLGSGPWGDPHHYGREPAP